MVHELANPYCCTRTASNNQNIYGRFYDQYSQQIETSYQTSLVPFLNYRVEF
ncbi:hypothetical protein [Hymenobacter sp.]|jgi:hypothetical protein|uniref:hypothetical protein n=1 Tax=Hymenobacter sp. TaxID=1898978 RepID=UPI002EDB0E76